MTGALVIVGGGGFGREAIDVAEAMNRAGRAEFDIVGVLDDSPSDVVLQRLDERGIRHLGGVRDWLATGTDAEYAIGIGDPAARARVDALFRSAGRRGATLVHPRAELGSVGAVGEGAVICAGAQVSTNVRLGRHVHVNPGAIIGHDSVLEDFVSVNPGAIVSGDVTIGAATLIGAGSVVLQGLRVGASSIVGAAACVTRDVADGVTVLGVPARQHAKDK